MKIILIAVVVAGLIVSSFAGYGYYSLQRADKLVQDGKIDEAMAIYETTSKLPFFRVAKIKLESLKNYKNGLEAFNSYKCQIAKEDLAKVSEQESYFNDARNKLKECEKLLDYAVIVNGNTITLEELKKEYDDNKTYYKAINYSLNDNQAKETKKQTLDSLIDNELIKEEAQKRGIEVFTSDIEGEYQKAQKENNGEMKLREALKKYHNWEPEEFKKQIEKQLLRRKLEEAIKKENKDFNKWLIDIAKKADIKKNQSAIDSL